MLYDGSIVNHEGHLVKDVPHDTAVSCLRRAILEMQSSKSTDHSSLDHFLNEYTRQVDDMKIINNYADSILQLATGCKNDSSRWRSAFVAEDILKELKLESSEEPPEVLCEEKLDQCSVDQLSSIIPALFKQLSLQRSGVPQLPTSDSSEQLAHSAPTAVLCAQVPTRCLPAPKRPLTTMSPPTAIEPKPHEIAKRLHPDQPESEPQSSPFQTAGAVLQQNLQKKQSDGYHPVASGYRVSKRTLGGRRGPNSHFVPPIPSSSSPGTNSSPHTTDASNVAQAGKEDGYPLGDERLKQFDQKTVDLIMSEVMESKTVISWEDIAGLEFQKKALQEVVILPMLRPDLFTGLRGPPKGLLLFGPPGTGKTLIGKCIASQSKSTFFCISASSLTSKWVGEGEKMVRALFAIARVHQPAVIFIDEVDSLLTQRSETEHESSRRIKTEFLVQLDGVSTAQEERLLFVGATNRPQELDEAARRRFVKRLYIPLPDLHARKQIVVNLLRQQQHSLAPADFNLIAERTDGYSGADMANLCREAAMGPIRSLTLEDIQSIACDEVRPVVLADFETALNHVRASVSPGDLQHYLKWNKQYGSFDA